MSSAEGDCTPPRYRPPPIEIGAQTFVRCCRYLSMAPISSALAPTVAVSRPRKDPSAHEFASRQDGSGHGARYAPDGGNGPAPRRRRHMSTPRAGTRPCASTRPTTPARSRRSTPAPAAARSTSKGAVATPDGRHPLRRQRVRRTTSRSTTSPSTARSRRRTPATVGHRRSTPSASPCRPTAQHVYVARSAGRRTVGVYDVGADGALTRASTRAAETQPVQVTLAPDGHSAYVTNARSGSVSQYDVAGRRRRSRPRLPPASRPARHRWASR